MPAYCGFSVDSQTGCAHENALHVVQTMETNNFFKMNRVLVNKQKKTPHMT